MDNLIKYESCLEKTNPTEVQKTIDVQVDLGHLLTYDSNKIDEEQLNDNKEEYLSELARDNVQILINSVWQLKTSIVKDEIVVKLPDPLLRIPREKGLPEPKPLTRFQKFVKEKGLKFAKKKKIEWNDILNEWVPKYGYKKKLAEKSYDFIREVPGNANPYENVFDAEEKIKSERVAKNEYRRLRNIAAANDIKVPSMGLPPISKMTAKQFNTAAQVAHVSTASFGKHQKRVPKEKHLSKGSILINKKEKIPPMDSKTEHQKNMAIVDSLLKNKPLFNEEKAVGFVRKHTSNEPEVSSKPGKGKGKGKGRVKSGRKPKGGKGKRVHKKVGRKRR